MNFNLKKINWSDYEALSPKDSETLYFVPDKNSIYVRDILFGGRHEFVTQDPTYPESGVLYINKTTFEAKIWDGTNWNITSKGYTTVIGDAPDDTVLPTSKAVADFVETKISDIVGDSSSFVTSITATNNGTLNVTKGKDTTTVHLTNTVCNPTWNQQTKQLTLPIVGGTEISIDLSKDLVVTAGKYNSDTSEIWLTIAVDMAYTDDSKVIKIPVRSLIDIYTGIQTTTATTTVSVSNEISVNVKVSSKPNNHLEIDTENGGLYVSTPVDDTKVSKIATGKTNEVLTATADGSMQASGKKIGSTAFEATPSGNTLATEIASKIYADGVAQSAISTAATDASNKSSAAETRAKAYADTLITWQDW